MKNKDVDEGIKIRKAKYKTASKGIADKHKLGVIIGN